MFRVIIPENLSLFDAVISEDLRTSKQTETQTN